MRDDAQSSSFQCGPCRRGVRGPGRAEPGHQVGVVAHEDDVRASGRGVGDGVAGGGGRGCCRLVEQDDVWRPAKSWARAKLVFSPPERVDASCWALSPAGRTCRAGNASRVRQIVGAAVVMWSTRLSPALMPSCLLGVVPHGTRRSRRRCRAWVRSLRPDPQEVVLPAAVSPG